MVGRRRGVSQRRVREVRFDSSSPDPHTVSLTRGSSSPTAPHFWHAPPSPSLRSRHRRSPSPILSSSPDLEDCSSSESRSIPELKVLLEGSMPATSSGSSTLSPATAVLVCHGSIAAVFPEDERLQLVRSESSCSISSPSLDDPSSMIAGVRMLVADIGGEEGGEASIGGAEVAGSTECLPCSSCPANIEHPGSAGAAVDAVDYGGRTRLFNGSSLLPGASVSHCFPSFIPDFGVAALVGGGEAAWVIHWSVAATPTGVPSPSINAAVDIVIEGMVSVGGLVRDDARVSPVVREALRSQPTDGLRQPPSSPVVPVSGVESGDGKDGIIDSWEDWLLPFPAAWSRKKSSEQIHSNRLMTKFNRASEVDGELRERFGCRRSSRISPLVLPVRSEIDVVSGTIVVTGGRGLLSDEEPISSRGGLREAVTHGDVGGVGSRGEVAMAPDSGSGSLSTDDSELSSIGMVSSSPSPSLDELRNLAVAIVDIPVSRASDSFMVVRSSGGGFPEMVAASRFAPLSELDEDYGADECGVRGDSDKDGHRIATSCVDAVIDASEEPGMGGRLPEAG
ncbi:hypothetical protein Dimus_036403 [Dionaea muscipula]